MSNPISSISPHKALTHASNIAVLSILSKAGPRRPALPVEIIILILSDPSRWIESARYTLQGPISVTSVASSKVVVCIPPLSSKSIRRLGSVLFTFTSKDQGWSSFHAEHGTYENSWTWFEAAVGNGITVSPLGPDQDRPGEDQDRIWEDQERRIQWDDLTNIKRQQLQINRHAGRVAEGYQIELVAGEGILQDLKEGDEIALLAFARFQGWVNFVESASIAVLELDDLQETITANHTGG